MNVTVSNSERVRRPGGRAERVGNDVHSAAIALLREPDWSKVSLAAIAASAGVNPATLYRRWGSLPNLIADVVTTLLERTSPLPDTGTLSGDVHAYAAKIAADLAHPDGAILIRAAALLGIGAGSLQRNDAVEGRTAQVDRMLDRARERGESCGTARDYFELVTGPLYGYALFAPLALESRAPILAERFLAYIASPT